MLRFLLFLAGILLAVPVLALIALALTIPVTFTGGLYLFGSFLLVAGLLAGFWQPKFHWMTLGGLVLILAVAGVRIGLTWDEDARLRVIVLPSGKDSRPVNALLDERDSLLFGEGLLPFIGGVSAREHEGIVPVVSAAYREVSKSNGVFASPVLSTYLGLQKPAAFDAVVVEPVGEQPPTAGVIFLHGFMGNVAMQCWEIAMAAEAIGAVTICPSTAWQGYWWTPDGQAILRATFAYLRDRGIQRIYLGGFSNGGHGIGRTISIIAKETGLRGLFFIAGANNAKGVRETQLPVLMLQGTTDERMPVELARQFAQEVGAQATYVELEADHFLIMKQPKAVQEAVGAWLIAQEKTYNLPDDTGQQ